MKIQDMPKTWSNYILEKNRFFYLLWIILVTESTSAAGQTYNGNDENMIYAKSKMSPLLQVTRDETQYDSFAKDTANINPILIGDIVPNFSFSILKSDKQMKISDFPKKLIILDFWATWCGSCIDKFPKLDTLQKKFNNKLIILLVNSLGTGDDKTKISTFFEKHSNNFSSQFSPLIAYNDKVATESFPHMQVPHYVWIAPGGKVIAITGSDQVNEKNIGVAIQNEENLNLPIKKDDYFPNKLLELPSDNILIDDDFLSFKLFRRGKIEGFKPMNKIRAQIVTEGMNQYMITRGRTFINMPLLEIYKIILQYKPEFYKFFSDERIVLELKDSSKLFFSQTNKTKDEWEKKNLYSYDIVVPANEAAKMDTMFSLICNDLNHYSGFFGRIEKRKIKYLKVIRTSMIDKLRSKGGSPENLTIGSDMRRIQNLPMRNIIGQIMSLRKQKLPVIDQTGYIWNIDIELNTKDMTSFKNSLNKYDLDVVEVYEDLDMFVLTEN